MDGAPAALRRCLRELGRATSLTQVLESVRRAAATVDAGLGAAILHVPGRPVSGDGLTPGLLEGLAGLEPVGPVEHEGEQWFLQPLEPAGVLALRLPRAPLGADVVAQLELMAAAAGPAVAAVLRGEVLALTGRLVLAAEPEQVLAALEAALVPAVGTSLALHLLDAPSARLAPVREVTSAQPEPGAWSARAARSAAACAVSGSVGLDLPGLLAVPLQVRGRVLGALVLHRAGIAFGPDEAAWVAEACQTAAVVLDALAARSDSADVAETLQRALLPRRLPELPAIEVAAHYAPARAGASGDWYDAFELPGGRLGFAVGDTMGRGVAAAAAMGQARAALRGFALEGHAPAEVLRRLDLVVRAFDDLQLTTCAYAVFDPLARRLTIASAGHLPPLLLDEAGVGGFLDVEVGVPLGAGGMRHGAYADFVITLLPAATVLLYTDGLLDHEAGLEGVREAGRAAVAAAAGKGLEAVLQGVLGEGGRSARDDVAMVAVRARAAAVPEPGSPQALEVELPASLHAARIARARVLAALTEWGHGGSDDAGAASGVGGFETVDSVVLLTDELVTNAVVHAQSPLRMQVRMAAGCVRVEVTDESPRLPAPRGQDGAAGAAGGDGLEAVAEGGRGLRLVELLASRWGVDPLPVGKRIWFEVQISAA